MQQLIEFINQHENWLINRILFYARKLEFTKYTSTLEEAWRISISGLSTSLAEGVSRFNDIPEFGPDETFTSDPLTRFGVIEAQRHRKRGITLTMFMGLMKYYRQSYLDLMEEKFTPAADRPRAELFLNRCFDRIEIAFCQEWTQTPAETLLNELQNTNRMMTNEKNAYLTVFESLADPAILIDSTFQIVNLNHAAAGLIECTHVPGKDYYQETYSPAERKLFAHQSNLSSVIGKSLETFFPWVFALLKNIHLEKLCQDQARCQADIHGKSCYFEVKWSNMLDISEKFTSIVIIIRDITAITEAEMKIKNREATLQSILRAVPVGIGLVSNRIIRQANQWMCDITGYQAEELLGQNTRMLYPTQKEYDLIGRDLSDQIRLYGSGTMEIPWRRKDGRIIDVLFSYSPLDQQDLSHEITFAVVDITDRKQAEKELNKTLETIKAVNVELDQFAYSVSHDLKNPLLTIKGMMQLIKTSMGQNMTETMGADFGFITNACIQMERILDGLLHVSRLGHTIGQPELADMRQLAHEAVDMCQARLHECRVTVTIDETLPRHLCDPLRVRQVLENLLTNAVKFMGDQPQPEIQIGWRSGENNPIFFVRDNGIGISPRHQQKIFDIFKRLHPEIEGCGLGLAIVKRVINAHNGRIWVESEGEGKGSTFCFTLQSDESGLRKPNHSDRGARGGTGS